MARPRAPRSEPTQKSLFPKLVLQEIEPETFSSTPTVPTGGLPKMSNGKLNGIQPHPVGVVSYNAIVLYTYTTTFKIVPTA